MNSPRSPFRLLFVCLGNICRSPAAEIIFRKQAADAGRAVEFEIDSAGTIGHHQGAPPDSRMAGALRNRGFAIGGKARRITEEDLEKFDLIVTMDETNLSDVRRLDQTGRYHRKIRPFVGFCQSHEVLRVPDPYYGGQRGFDHVIEILRDGCRGILASLETDHQVTSALETQDPNAHSSPASPHETRITSP